MLTPKQREMWRVNKYVWVMLAFALAWLIWRWGQFGPAAQRGLAWVFAAGTLNVAARTWVAYRSPQGTSGRWGWPFTVADIALIAAAIRLSGGLVSDLWLVYFVLVVTETMGVLPKDKWLLTGLTLAGYAAAVWPPTDAVTLVTRLFFLYLVSALADRLARNKAERDAQVARLRQELGIAEEKSRVARELHDGLGREIVNVILGLEVVRRTAEKAPAQVKPLLDENLALLRGAMNQTRDLVFQTRPWTPEGDGCATVGERVESYARQWAARTGLVVSVRCDLGDREISPQTAYGLLRIVQEALNNVAKHAHAAHVMVELRREKDRVCATVTDDGDGFAAQGDGHAPGIGLQAMRERAAALGGRASIESRPGQGTTVTAELPA